MKTSDIKKGFVRWFFLFVHCSAATFLNLFLCIPPIFQSFLKKLSELHCMSLFHGNKLVGIFLQI